MKFRIFQRLYTTALLLYLCLIASVAPHAYGQAYHFERFGFDEGLPHTEVNDVIQGPDHRIFAATEEGLAVFNGLQFDVYTRKDNLESDDIHLLYSDFEERVWIASTGDGLNYFFQDSIYRVPDIKDKLQGKKIYEIFQRSDSTLFFVTGLDVLAFKSDTIYSVWDQLNKPAPEFAGVLAALLQDSLMYINQPGGYFIKINLNTYHWNFINNKNPLPPIILSVEIHENGRLFLSGNEGLFEFRADTLYTIHQHVPPRCWDMDFDGDGHLWLFSEVGGFGKYNPHDQTFVGYSTSSGMPTDVLFAGTIDQESNIWLASANEGLIRFRDQSLMKFNASNGIPNNSVTSLTSLGDTVYLATTGGVVLMEDEKIIDTLLANKWISSVYASSDHVLVGASDGIYKIYSSRKVQKLPASLGHNELNVNQTHFSLTTGEVFVKSDISLDTIRLGWIKAVEAIGDQFILMLDDRIALYDSDTTYFLSDFDAHKYGSFRSMTSWQNDVLIKSDQHIHRITKRDGMLSLHAFDISEIPFAHQLNAIAHTGGSLWLAGSGQFVVLQLNDLIESNQLIYKRFPIGQSSVKTAISNNGILAHNGTIYGRNSNGLVIFDPRQYKANQKEARIRLMDVKLYGRSLEKDRWIDHVAEFDVSENNIAFHMIAHTFANVEGVQYKYKLESGSSDSEWIGPVSNNEVVFSNLTDGQYYFKFIANNGYGVWNKTPLQFSFTINKPFWKKSIFWVILLSAVVMLVLASFLYRNRQKLQVQKRIKEKLIEIQELERKRIAQELHDSIGQKVMLIAMQAKEIDAPHINELALSSLKETRTISQGLHPVILDQLGLSEGIKDMLSKMDEATDEFIDFSIDNVDSCIPKKHHIHLFRIVQELLTNSLKHANATACSITLYREDQAVLLKVIDNGSGFEKHATRTGMGLQSVGDRIDLLGATMQILSNHGTSIHIVIPFKGQFS